jgi:hypothetical protein
VLTSFTLLVRSPARLIERSLAGASAASISAIRRSSSDASRHCRQFRDGLRSNRNNAFHHRTVTCRKIRRFRTFHDKSQEGHGIRRHRHRTRASNPAEDFGAKTPKAELEFAPAPAPKEWSLPLPARRQQPGSTKVVLFCAFNLSSALSLKLPRLQRRLKGPRRACPTPPICS